MIGLQTRNFSASPGVSRGWRRLETQTIASAQASADFTSRIDGSHRFYKVKGWAIPDTDAVTLLARLAVAGVFQSGATDYKWSLNRVNEAGNSFDAGSAADSSVRMAVGVGSAAGEAVEFELSLTDPADTNFNTLLDFEGAYESSSALLTNMSGGGRLQSASAVNGLQLLFGTGNIALAELVLWGLN